jgi:hypothetical protein
MDVLNAIIQNSALNGMPKWYKATTLLLFSSILVTLIAMLTILLIYGPYMTIQYGF